VVIDDSDIACASFFPEKANAPLAVDPNTVLSRPVARKGFKPITRRYTEIIQDARLIEHTEFAQGNRLNVRREFSASLARPYQSSFTVGEATDHDAL
jgi:hypothetical protein